MFTIQDTTLRATLTTLSPEFIIRGFRQAFADKGLRLPVEIIADGAFHRFATKPDQTGDAGYYRLSLHPPYGLAGDWRTKTHYDFEAHVENETPAQAAQFERAQQQAKQAYQELVTRRHQEVRDFSNRLWNAAHPDPALVSTHDYLVTKNLVDIAVAAGLRVQKKALFVPMRDETGELWNLQQIAPDGRKAFIPGGRVEGLFFQLGNDPPLYLCEGPADALSIHAAGRSAVCTFGTTNMPVVATALANRGTRFIVAADHDDAGLTVARAIQRATGCRIVHPTEPGQDFSDLHTRAGSDAVRAALEGQGQATELMIEGPSPLLRPIEAPERYPVKAFGQWAGMIERVSQVMNVDPVMVGQSFITAASLAVQGLADIGIDGRRYPLSVFAVTVAGSGERKSAVDRLLLDEHRAYERDVKTKADLARMEATMGRKAHGVAEAGLLKTNKDNGQSALIAALKSLGEPPADPPTQAMLVHDLTLEGLVKLLQNNRPSVAAITDEGGRILGGWALGKDHVTRTVSGLSSLWDGSPLVVVRAGDGVIQLYGRRLALHWQVQPGVAQLLFGRPEFADQGFLWRCLIAHPPLSRPAPYNATNLGHDPLVLAYYQRIRELLTEPLPVDTDDLGQPALELRPRVLQFEDQAKSAWVDCFNHLENLAAEDGSLFAIRGYARKTAEHIARLAGVFALMADPQATTVPLVAVESGAKLMLDFYLNEMLRLHEGNAISQEVLTAQRLLEWMRGREVIYLSQVYQQGPRPIRTKEIALKAITTLVNHGWLARIEGGATLAGIHRRDAWRVVQEENTI